MRDFRDGCAGYRQVPRRAALQVGSLGALGLSLGGYFRLQAARGEGRVALADGRAALSDRAALLTEQPVAGLEVARKRVRLSHVRIMQSTTQLTRADSSSCEKYPRAKRDRTSLSSRG